MLVKAIRLRKKGEKLSRTVVGQSEPVLGNLNVELVPDPDQKRTVMAFLVQPGSAGTEVFPALDNVKLVAVRGDSFLITGIERFFDRLFILSD